MHPTSKTERSSFESPQADCPNLSVIIPYRDRKEHLDILIPRLFEVLPLPFEITIIEQADQKLFNRGSLFNAAVLEGSPSRSYCFHDVDFYPIDVSYVHPEVPTRPFTYTIGHKDYTEKFHQGKLERLLQEKGWGKEVRAPVYSDCFGGVILISRPHFLAVNGYSNRYPFWGYEDLDFRLRCEKANLQPIVDPKGEFRLLPHRHAVQLEPENKDLIWENRRRFEKLEFNDGLSNVEYSVVERKTYQGCRWISVTF